MADGWRCDVTVAVLAPSVVDTVLADCVAFLGADQIATQGIAGYLADEAGTSGLRGRASAVLFPRNAEQVAQVVRACCAGGVPMTPRGGGTGYEAARFCPAESSSALSGSTVFR